MGQVGVEGHAVAGVQLVLGVFDVQGEGAAFDPGRLAGARLVARRVPRAAWRSLVGCFPR